MKLEHLKSAFVVILFNILACHYRMIATVSANERMVYMHYFDISMQSIIDSVLMPKGSMTSKEKKPSY